MKLTELSTKLESILNRVENTRANLSKVQTDKLAAIAKLEESVSAANQAYEQAVAEAQKVRSELEAAINKIVPEETGAKVSG